MDVLCNMAHRSIGDRPNTAASSIKASISSFELNTGNLCVRIDRSITPADQMSIAEPDQQIPRILEESAYRQSDLDI